jgi:hypothetical protein
MEGSDMPKIEKSNPLMFKKIFLRMQKLCVF